MEGSSWEFPLLILETCADWAHDVTCPRTLSLRQFHSPDSISGKCLAGDKAAPGYFRREVNSRERPNISAKVGHLGHANREDFGVALTAALEEPEKVLVLVLAPTAKEAVGFHELLELDDLGEEVAPRRAQVTRGRALPLGAPAAPRLTSVPGAERDNGRRRQLRAASGLSHTHVARGSRQSLCLATLRAARSAQRSG